MKISITKAKSNVLRLLKAGLVPNLISSPGLGKSDLIRQIAEENNLKIIDCRLSQMDSSDLNGFPTINEARTRSNFAPPEYIPLEGDKISNGYNGWILFFDEMTSAPQSMQAAAYKIVLDRAIGTHNLHDKVLMVCAGNLMTDRAIVNKLSTAMQSRLIHLEIEVDTDAWIDWATKADIDHRVIGFIKFRPELLHKFSPNHNDNTFPCPRTWEFVSKIIKKEKEITMDITPSLAGAVGEGVSIELYGFLQIYTHLPSIEEIINAPEFTRIPHEPSHMYAISSLISSHLNKKNAEHCIKYINRLPIEFQVITLQCLRIKPELATIPSIRLWIGNNSCDLIE